MWWRIYFWVALIISIIGVVFIDSQLELWSFADWIEISSSLLGLLGLYTYVYKKKILSSKIWIVFFWVIVISWVFNIIYMFTPLEQTFPLPEWMRSRSITNGTEMLLSILIASPMAYAIYKLGQNNFRKS